MDVLSAPKSLRDHIFPTWRESRQLKDLEVLADQYHSARGKESDLLRKRMALITEFDALETKPAGYQETLTNLDNEILANAQKSVLTGDRFKGIYKDVRDYCGSAVCNRMVRTGIDALLGGIAVYLATREAKDLIDVSVGPDFLGSIGIGTGMDIKGVFHNSMEHMAHALNSSLKYLVAFDILRNGYISAKLGYIVDKSRHLASRFGEPV